MSKSAKQEAVTICEQLMDLAVLGDCEPRDVQLYAYRLRELIGPLVNR